MRISEELTWVLATKQAKPFNTPTPPCVDCLLHLWRGTNTSRTDASFSRFGRLPCKQARCRRALRGNAGTGPRPVHAQSFVASCTHACVT